MGNVTQQNSGGIYSVSDKLFICLLCLSGQIIKTSGDYIDDQAHSLQLSSYIHILSLSSKQYRTLFLILLISLRFINFVSFSSFLHFQLSFICGSELISCAFTLPLILFVIFVLFSSVHDITLPLIRKL